MEPTIAALREICVDCETTGLDAEIDRIVEVGAIEIGTDRTFRRLINPERTISPGAVKVHGYTQEALRDCPKFVNIVDDFLAFLGDAPLVIHNAHFDLSFINAELARLGRPPIPKDRAIDTLPLARKRHPGKPNSLDALCHRYRIGSSARVKHGALIDAQLLAGVYLKLIAEQSDDQLILSFKREDGPPAEIILVARQPRPIFLDPFEAVDHEAFIKTLGPSAVWQGYRWKGLPDEYA